ncbi:hypothetical protein ACFY0P_06575 [Streptomyces sp. NPDC001714]|uniref:hypothetical protein n=1 Tax=Streptomyces sp. NPDC001714 TaxID=3364603 RepID=UPI0036804781
MPVDDGGLDFLRLREVELPGRAEAVGETPRKGGHVAELTGPENLFADRYMGGGTFRYDGRHGRLRLRLRLRPERIAGWDFGKLRA